MQITFENLPVMVAELNEKVDTIFSLLSQQPQKEEKEEDLTVNELATYLRCSRVTIHARKKDGTFPYYQVGRKVFFRKSEVDKVLRNAGYGEKKGGIAR